MLTYVKNKLLHNKWMAVSLLIGNILLISIAATIPMYSDAALQRMLTRQLSEQMEQTGRYPAITEFRGEFSDIGSDKVPLEKLTELEKAAEDFMKEEAVPASVSHIDYYKTKVSARQDSSDGSLSSILTESIQVRLDALTGFEDHVTVLSGKLPSSQLKENNTLEAVVSSQTMAESGLYLGEVLRLDTIKDVNDEPFRVEIVGVVESQSSTDPYWSYNPNTTDHYLFLNADAFTSVFKDTSLCRAGFMETIYVNLSYQQIKASKTSEILDVCETYTKRVDEIFNDGFYANYTDLLTSFKTSEGRLNRTLVVLQVPVFLLLCAFIIMVSRQMLSMDENEIAMLKSRGSSRRQILNLYLLQSSIMAGMAFVISLPLSYFICQTIGSANSFMEFVQRKALPARFTYLPVWLFAVGAALLSVAAMVIPAFRFAKTDIVDYKRTKHKSNKPLWQRLYLDVILLAVSLYGLYRFQSQTAYFTAKSSAGASADPLLYLCSSLFLLGCAMLFVRLFPLLIRLVYQLFKKHWPSALYVSFLRMIRSRGSQDFIMIFLVLTLGLGMFSSQTARTINSNAEEEIRYANGADIVLKENWTSRQLGGEGGKAEQLYVEPDFTKYEKLVGQGASSVTKVYVSSACSASASSKNLSDVVLMGIHTREFGETATFRDGLLDDHWYYYLNAMSQDADAVLVSTKFRDEMGLKLGDTLSYQVGSNAPLRGTIYGFVDYWPSLTPPEKADESEGQNGYFIVASFSKITSSWGTQPYQVWIRNASGSSQYIYDFAEDNQLKFVTFKDTNADLIRLKNDPVFQATNGILTVGFMVVLVLCSVGFLIYWILSIHSRRLQFGIFRAMGMTMKEIVGMLVNEQLWLSLSSIVAGVLVGHLTSQLFVPLIQVTYAGAGQNVPLTVVTSRLDEIRLLTVVGAVMIVCLIILSREVRKIRIAQALKLGED